MAESRRELREKLIQARAARGTPRAHPALRGAGRHYHRPDKRANPERDALRNGALAESLGDATFSGYGELLREFDAERRPKPKRRKVRAAIKGAWIRVKAHRRHRPKR